MHREQNRLLVGCDVEHGRDEANDSCFWLWFQLNHVGVIAAGSAEISELSFDRSPWWQLPPETRSLRVVASC